MQINIKFIKGGVLDGDLSVLGKFALPSLLTENDSNTALFVASDNSVKKRLLGSLAFKSATDFYTRNEVDNTFLKNTGGTITGYLTVSNNLVAGKINAEKIAINSAINPTKNTAGLTLLGFSGTTGAQNWALRGVYQYFNGVNSNADGGDIDLIKALDGNTILGTKTDGTGLGFVGVGTTSPQARFHVDAATNNVLFTGLGTANGSIKFAGTGSAGAGIWFNTQGAYITTGGSNELLNYNSVTSHVFLANGSEIARLSGNSFTVGVWQTLGADLRLLTSTRGVGGRAIVHDTGNILSLNYGNDFAATRIGGNILFNNGNPSYITNSNFGIGTITPSEALEVVGNIKLGLRGYLYTTSNELNPVIKTSRSDATMVGTLSTNGWGDFQFSKGLSVGYSDAFTGFSGLLVNGAVGIGTKTPSEQLHVAKISQNLYTNILVENNASAGWGAGILLKNTYGTDVTQSEITYDYFGSAYSPNSHGLNFVSGRPNNSNYFFRKSDKSLLVKFTNAGDVDIIGNYYRNGVVLNNFSGKYADLTGTPDMGAVWGAINGKANTSHRHNFSDIDGFFLGIKPQMETGRAYYGSSNLYSYNVYGGQTTNSPSGLTFGNVLTWGGNGSATQLVTGWTAGDQNFIAFRSIRDNIDDWWAFKRIYHEGYKPLVADIGGLNNSLNAIWQDIHNKANSNHTHDYNNLSNRPDLSAYLTWGNVVSDNANVNTTNGNPIATKLVSGYVNDLWGAVNSKANANHTHDYYSISNRPVLFSGNYNDLSNKPDLSGYIYGVPFSGRSSIPNAGLQVSQHLSFTGDIRVKSLFITENVFAEKAVYVTGNIDSSAGVYGESLHSTHGLTLQNPTKLLDTDVNLVNVSGVYVEGLAGVVTKLTLNQFINLLEQL